MENTSQMEKNVEGFVEHLFKHLKDLAADYLPKLTAAILLLVIGIWLANRIKGLIKRSMRKRELDPSLQGFIPGLVAAILKVLVFVTGAGMIGIETTSFVAVLGAAGLAIGLALQGSLANFAGGVLILILKPFRVGDVINAQGQVGLVKEIQIFHTIIVSGDNKTIVIPNGILSNGIIINNTSIGSERFDITIVIEASNDLKKVQQVALDTCRSIPNILQSPATSVGLTRFTSSDVELLIQPFVMCGTTGEVRNMLIPKLMEAFEKNGVKLSTPVLRLGDVAYF